MIRLLSLMCAFAHAGNISHFVSPQGDSDNEACNAAERVILTKLHPSYEPIRSSCMVLKPKDKDRYENYSVIGCAGVRVKTVCDGFSGKHCNHYSYKNVVCKGFDVQLEDGVYVGVSQREDLTQEYDKLNGSFEE